MNIQSKAFRSSISHDAELRAGWVAVLSVNLPDGTVRHPGLFDLIQATIECPCILDNRYEGVRLSFSVDGETEDDARSQSQVVGQQLLDLLGLEPSDIIENTLDRPTTPRVGQWGNHLKIVSPEG